MKSEFCFVIIRIIQIIISIMFVCYISFWCIILSDRTYNSNASRDTWKDFMRWLEIDLRSLRYWVGRLLFVGAKGGPEGVLCGQSQALRLRTCSAFPRVYSTQPVCARKGEDTETGERWGTPWAPLCRARVLRQWKLKVFSTTPHPRSAQNGSARDRTRVVLD